MRDTRKLFFLHLMKTGGASFRALLRTVVPGARIFPAADDVDLISANQDIARLLALGPERRRSIDVYTGHFPFVVTELLADPVWTATVLRDPVARTISLLKHCRRYNPEHRGLDLETIYDDPMLHPMQIRNYQCKLFSMTPDDQLESQLDVIHIDEDRLSIACRQLEAVHVIGLHHRYEAFVEEMSARTGWGFGHVGRWRRGEPDEVSPALRKRIAEDNAMDLRFFDHAVSVVDARASAVSS